MRKWRRILTFLFLALVICWAYIFCRFETVRLFTCFVPLAIIIIFSKNIRRRNAFITLFVILWSLLFHYESIRHFYLELPLQKPFYKTKFLFPPAGWIMFYNIDDQSGHVEVYGVKGADPQFMDPHDIFRTRTIGFDNIHRGILGTVASRYRAKDFCRYLDRRFPYFDRFYVSYVHHPSITKRHYQQVRSLLYVCGE